MTQISTESLVELVFAQAPHMMEGVTTESGEPAYMWWDAQIRDTSEIQLTETIEHLKTFFKEQGPFDGVFGFSQGGIMTSLISILQAEEKQSLAESNQNSEPVFSFKFAIIIAASFPLREQVERFAEKVEQFKGNESVHSEWLLIVFQDRASKIKPAYFPATMHVFGSADPIVNPDHSRALANYFPDPVIYEHDGKHFARVTAPAKKEYFAFVSRFLW